jgi:hypothetical protein
MRTASLEEQIRQKLEREVGLSPSEIVLARPYSLQMTSSGKLMRRHARELYHSRGFEPPYGLLHPAWIRSRLARLWSRPEPIGA